VAKTACLRFEKHTNGIPFARKVARKRTAEEGFMKLKLILATLLLATSAFGAGFVRVGVGPGFGYRGGFYGGVVVAAPVVRPYYARPYYPAPVVPYVAPAYAPPAYYPPAYYPPAYYPPPVPAYGYGVGYGYARPGYRYAPGFVGPRYYGGARVVVRR
jgi:hypothetical protein